LKTLKHIKKKLKRIKLHLIACPGAPFVASIRLFSRFMLILRAVFWLSSRIPHKHYTRPTILGFARAYVESEKTTYKQAVMVDLSVPGYPESQKPQDPSTIHPESGKTLAPSTVHRWITTLSRLGTTAQKALDLVLQENPSSSVCRDLAQLNIPRRKYRSPARKERLLSCRRLLLTEAFFQAIFKTSIFTKLAIRYAFT
jgi:hypothetical protein